MLWWVTNPTKISTYCPSSSGVVGLDDQMNLHTTWRWKSREDLFLTEWSENEWFPTEFLRPWRFLVESEFFQWIVELRFWRFLSITQSEPHGGFKRTWFRFLSKLEIILKSEEKESELIDIMAELLDQLHWVKRGSKCRQSISRNHSSNDCYPWRDLKTTIP